MSHAHSLPPAIEIEEVDEEQSHKEGEGNEEDSKKSEVDRRRSQY